jgi:hypothetical protein
MKKSFLILIIAGFLLIGLSEIQAQTTQPKLNQVELMKQFIGTWECELSKDTILTIEFSPLGSGIVAKAEVTTMGKTLDELVQLWGFDEKTNNEVIVQLWKSNPNLRMLTGWWTSKNTAQVIPYQNLSKPEDATETVNSELKTPDLWIETHSFNGKVIAVFKFIRIKK